MNILENEVVGLYLYATAKRKAQEPISDDDELYYKVLDELEKHGWYDSSSGELECKDQGDLAFIVDDYMIGFENDFPGLAGEIRKMIESKSEMHAPEIMFACVFEALRRMMAN